MNAILPRLRVPGGDEETVQALKAAWRELRIDRRYGTWRAYSGPNHSDEIARGRTPARLGAAICEAMPGRSR